jgi:branched-chain amino acid transport system substrate-binding protein
MLVANESGRTQGAMSVAFVKDPASKRWARDRGMRLYRRIMRRYVHANPRNGYYLAGMASAYTLVAALKKAGRHLTRKSLMRAMTHLRVKRNPFVLPGIVIKTTPTDRYPIERAQLERWKGTQWRLVGKLVRAPRR